MAKTAKYFIYHIPGIKIGVSNNPEHRVIKQQGFTEYEILEEHTNAKVVSKREQELQAQYGYPVDKTPYYKTLRWQKKGQTKEARNKAVANTDYSYTKNNKPPKSAYTPEAIAKRVANTDYKAATAKVDYKARTAKIDYSKYTLSHWHTPEARKKAMANIDWEARNKKINHKVILANVDWKARNANVDWEAKSKKLKKPINQYDLEGNFIKRWDSATDAAKSLNKRQGDINHCCRGKQKHAFKFIWKYAN